MDKMLVVVFDDESKAYDGIKALRELDAEASLALYAAAVIYGLSRTHPAP
jgi:hypothetical protein